MEQLGPYRIEREVGRGGMGVVYRAVHEALGRPTALKVLAASGELSDTQRKRFQREAQALARLDHPGIVRLYEQGEDEGRVWLALEWVEGESLATRLERSGRLPVGIAVGIASQLAEALAHAHAQGVLHRDLKPENVLLRPDGQAVLTDFGLTRDVDPSLSQTALSVRGRFLGTPGYWAPEQARGQVEAFGPPTDVYGFGATLYALLCGQPPHGEPRSLVEALALVREPPTPPSRLNRDVDPALEALVLRCLELEPARRFPDGQALEAALAAWRQPGRSSVASSAPGRGAPGGLPPWLRSLGGALTLALGIGLGLALARRMPAPAALPPGPVIPSPTSAGALAVSPSPAPRVGGPHSPDAPDAGTESALLEEVRVLLQDGQLDRAASRVEARRASLEGTASHQAALQEVEAARAAVERALRRLTRRVDHLQLEDLARDLSAQLTRWPGSALMLDYAVGLELSLGRRDTGLELAERLVSLTDGQGSVRRLLEGSQEYCRRFARPSMVGDRFWSAFELLGGADWHLGDDDVLTVEGPGLGPGAATTAYLKGVTGQGRYRWSVELQADWRAGGGLALVVGAHRAYEAAGVTILCSQPVSGDPAAPPRKTVNYFLASANRLAPLGILPPSLPDRDWVRIGLEVDGARLQYLVDDQPVGAPATAPRELRGRVALTATGGMPIRFRDWRYEAR